MNVAFLSAGEWILVESPHDQEGADLSRLVIDDLGRGNLRICETGTVFGSVYISGTCGGIEIARVEGEDGRLDGESGVLDVEEWIEILLFDFVTDDKRHYGLEAAKMG